MVRSVTLAGLCLVLLAALTSCGSTPRQSERIQLVRDGDRSRLEVRWEIYENPTSGSTIELLNMVHLAEPDYFARVQERLDAHELVFMEGVKGESFADLAESYRRVSKALLLTPQSSALLRRDHFRTADMTTEEIGDEVFKASVRIRMAASALRNRAASVAEELAEDHPDLSEAERKRAAIRGPLREELARGLVIARRNDDEEDEVLIVRRNDVLLAHVEEVLKGPSPPSRFAICYGATHADGIVDRLESWGYRLETTEWATLFHVHHDTRDAAKSSTVSQYGVRHSSAARASRRAGRARDGAPQKSASSTVSGTLRRRGRLGGKGGRAMAHRRRVPDTTRFAAGIRGGEGGLCASGR